MLQAGAATALAHALTHLDYDPRNDPVRVNLLRVLADLAKSNNAASFFENARVADALVATLKNHPPPLHGKGWLEWAASLLGWSSSDDSPTKPADRPGDMSAAQSNEEAMVDYLAGLSTPPTHTDLGAGISYHAVRCASNLARNSLTHAHLLDAGLLPLLCDALRNADVSHFAAADHQLTELVLCTILAVAALAKSAPSDVVARGAHKRLLYFMKEEHESVAQMYAAGGIRNLARHGDRTAANWRVHRELVVNGAVDALRAGMAKEASPQTRTFSVLAFGDLMTTGHHKADIIRRWLEPAFRDFANLVNEKNAAITRTVYRTLSALFGGDGTDKRNGETLVLAPPALCALLAKESGQIINGPVARGDLPALKAVHAMCREETLAQGMVDRGLLEVLVRGASKGKGEYWEESVAALGILAGWEKLEPLMAPRGALKAILARPCLKHDGRWTAQFLANMARSGNHQVQVARGGLKVLSLSLVSKDEAARHDAARAFYNLSLGGVSRVMLAQGGILGPLVRTASSSAGDTRRFAIATLAKISEGLEHTIKLVEADTISVMLQAAKEDSRIAKDAAFCIATMSQVVEVHGSLARSGAAAWLVEMLSKNGGRGPDAAETMQYAALGVCNLAYSAGVTRNALRENGALSVLTAISASTMGAPQTAMISKQALKNLKGNEKPGMLPVQRAGNEPLPA